jgi:hypothetical protein
LQNADTPTTTVCGFLSCASVVNMKVTGTYLGNPKEHFDPRFSSSDEKQI